MIHEVIDLWEGINDNTPLGDNSRPKMTVYIRSGEQKRGVVLILPGGGYSMTSPREAEPIALQFNKENYHAVFVDYSVAPAKHPQPLLDAARALTIVKDNAKLWHVDMDQLYVCGFSAGGHLCASISNFYQEKWLNEINGINLEGVSIRGSILSYAVLTYGEYMHKGSFMNLLGHDAPEETYRSMSMENCIHENTPPTFLWHTVDDSSVPVENSLIYAMTLKKYGIPFEMHLFPNGPHGISLATPEVATSKDHINNHVAGWVDLCIKWMKEGNNTSIPLYTEKLNY